MRTYLRPLALLWGPDARDAIAAKRAGSLGGSPWIGFMQAELVSRDGAQLERSIVSYVDAPAELLHSIEAPRPEICGLALDAPRLMGIVNVTPDSFSDGGLYAEARTAIAHGKLLIQEGAHFLDVGGESTRPGARELAVADEAARVMPVIEGLDRAGAAVSVDTRKAPVMSAAAEAGARLINDVSALSFDPDSLATAAGLGLPVVLMHAQGTPETMQADPRYDDVALDVYDYLQERVAACLAAGIARERLIIDPGIGFGKTSRHNVELLQQLALFHGLGLPLLVGLSRKGFTGHLTGEPQPRQRVFGSAAGAQHAMLHGAQILRVHDVKATRQALAVARAAVDPEASGL